MTLTKKKNNVFVKRYFVLFLFMCDFWVNLLLALMKFHHIVKGRVVVDHRLQKRGFFQKEQNRTLIPKESEALYLQFPV